MTHPAAPISKLFSLIADWWVRSGNLPDDHRTLLHAETDEVELTFNRGKVEDDDIPPITIRIAHKRYVAGFMLVNPYGGAGLAGLEDEMIEHFEAELKKLDKRPPPPP